MTLPRAKQSIQNHFTNSNRLRKCQDGIWKNARTAPMWVATVPTADGKGTKKRYTRLIPSAAYKTSLSGACGAVFGETELDMLHLGMEPLEDSKQRPFAMSMSQGAAFLVRTASACTHTLHEVLTRCDFLQCSQKEQWMACLVQEILTSARAIRNGVRRHARNHPSVIRLAIKNVRENLFRSAMDVPEYTIVLPVAMSRKKKAGEEVAPGDADVADVADEAEAEEEDVVVADEEE